MSQKLTLWMDGRIPVVVDREEFAIVRLMVEAAGAHQSIERVPDVMHEMIQQGYSRARALDIIILARNQWHPRYAEDEVVS